MSELRNVYLLIIVQDSKLVACFKMFLVPTRQKNALNEANRDYERRRNTDKLVAISGFEVMCKYFFELVMYMESIGTASIPF
jgi:hypothetical protein